MRNHSEISVLTHAYTAQYTKHSKPLKTPHFSTQKLKSTINQLHTLLFKRKNIIPSSINFILPSTSTQKRWEKFIELQVGGNREGTSLCFLVFVVVPVVEVLSVRVVRLDLAVTPVIVLLTSSPKSGPLVSTCLDTEECSASAGDYGPSA